MTVLSVVRNHKVSVASMLFLAVFIALHIFEPSIIFDETTGEYRQFGVGYRHKTILPIWFVVLLVALFSYLAVTYYVM
jgi:hypothetical protein